MMFDGLNTLNYELKNVLEDPLVTFVRIVIQKKMYSLWYCSLERMLWIIKKISKIETGIYNMSIIDVTLKVSMQKCQLRARIYIGSYVELVGEIPF